MQGLNSFQASFSCNGNAMLLLAMQILLQSLTGCGHATSRRPHPAIPQCLAETYLRLTQVLGQLFDLGNSKATSIQVQRGSRNWNKFAPGEASKQSPSRKPLQPTLWERHCMIACTHHAAFDVWSLGLAKAFAALRLSMITVCKLQTCFLFAGSHVLSFGLKMH